MSMRMIGGISGAMLMVAVLTGPAMAAVSATEPTSSAVREAKQAYEAAVKQAEAQLAAAKAEYLKQLDAAMKVAMQAGDLEEANRIDMLRKAVRATTAPTEVGSVPSEEKKPGWVVGSVRDSAGKLIKDAQITVQVYGTTIPAGQRTVILLDVDENGHFKQELPDGLYRVTATLVKEFEGKRYELELHPNDNKQATMVSSRSGIVKHFTWKLTGLQPGDDPRQRSSYYGAFLVLDDANPYERDKQLTAVFGSDAKAVLTLTPLTPLIDGSEGKVITIEAPLAELNTASGYTALDLPIARYRMEAKAITKEGKEQPLGVKLNFSADPVASVEAVLESPESTDPLRMYLSN